MDEHKLDARIVEAQRTADSAVSKIASHEEVCAFRYETINAKLDTLPNLYLRMDSLSALANKAIGLWLATIGLSVILGIVIAVIAIVRGG